MSSSFLCGLAVLPAVTERGRVLPCPEVIDQDCKDIESGHEQAHHSVAESGTTFFLFEQHGASTKVSALQEMVDHGINTWLILCASANHSAISANAFNYGIFSWSAGENIDLHFGHCSEFQVIEVTDNESWEVTGSIEAGRACDGQCNHDYIGDVAQKLKECRYVLSVS